ncbi:MAG: SDR family NAD(P)-dependent oxidoreductase, partial [Thermoanaerobaculia bacterium]
MKYDASGRVVIITGGAGGVGTTVSRRWLQAGASVLVVDRKRTILDTWLTGHSGKPWTNRIGTFAID